MFFVDEEGVKPSLLLGGTDAASPDVFAAVAGGRSALRVNLLNVAELVAQLKGWSFIDV